MKDIGIIVVLLFALTVCDPEGVGQIGAKINQGYSNQMEK